MSGRFVLFYRALTQINILSSMSSNEIKGTVFELSIYIN